MNDHVLTRREELLADGALDWLEGGDATAFDALLRDAAVRADFAAIERTAAVASLALGEPPAAVPADLVRLTAKLQADALAFFAGRGRPDGSAPRLVGPAPAPEPPMGQAQATPPSHHVLRVLPWLLAAASLLILLWPQFVGQPAPAVARAALLKSDAMLVQCDLQPGPSPRGGEVTGDVVWAADRQEGFLRLRGLPPLDPGHRYQLWIVDATREGPPVDGGLLDLPPSPGEVVVHVASRLPVQKAAAFVITLEDAKGVVVSQREHVVAIAKP